jgi:hypothetical protein
MVQESSENWVEIKFLWGGMTYALDGDSWWMLCKLEHPYTPQSTKKYLNMCNFNYFVLFQEERFSDFEFCTRYFWNFSWIEDLGFDKKNAGMNI